MRLLLPISLSLLLLSWQTAPAQLAPVDDFFHSGAQFYISNNIPSALEQVEAGRKIYPDDEKLKKLEELLKQKQQQQQQQQDKQQQDQKNQNQQNQPQPQKSDDQKNQQQQNQQQQQSSQKDGQDQPKPDQQEKNQAGEKKDEPPKPSEEQKSSADKKDGKKPEDQNGEGQAVAPGQMTPQEAKRLLDAQKGDEQVLKWQPKGKPQDPRRPVKDW